MTAIEWPHCVVCSKPVEGFVRELAGSMVMHLECLTFEPRLTDKDAMALRSHAGRPSAAARAVGKAKGRKR